jgi:methyltransferase-like protein
LTRYLATTPKLITNRVHQSIPADALGRAVIQLCDGSKSEADIVEAVADRVVAGKLDLKEKGTPIKERARAKAVLTPMVRQTLAKLARCGFFAPANKAN